MLSIPRVVIYSSDDIHRPQIARIYKICDKTVFKVLGIIMYIGFTAYLGYYFAYYLFKEENMILFGVLFGLLLGCIFQYLSKFIVVPEELKKPLLILSIAGLAVMFVQLGLVEIAKTLWGRVRFRELLEMGSYDAFTPWYHLNGSNGHRSFPSGHTGGASMSYLMLYLPFVSEKWRKRSTLCFVVPFVFTSTVAFTRLVVGAHYLSDVTVGGTIGFITVFVGLIILEKKYFKDCTE